MISNTCYGTFPSLGAGRPQARTGSSATVRLEL
ncbi:hypothetical protein PIGHUM_00785 [Pigmentiphaga humi]|uniref:Uncharacterized protein n=1 Tax=Pigmentiphaga humi TaxID=2478468 RepID=A0A3P4AXI4_9BURK|nr:hypothetical protein PIGHUM_00785 [Pigmentiphaga humi]